MSRFSLSELHIVPSGTNVRTEYYIDEILKKTCLNALARTGNMGGVLEWSMVPLRCKHFFLQYRASCNTSNDTQNWLNKNIPDFWDKETYPLNSPDLNPIENLWAILKESLDEMKLPFMKIKQMKNAVHKAWRNIDPCTLEQLVLSMPDRIERFIKYRGGYTGY